MILTRNARYPSTLFNNCDAETMPAYFVGNYMMRSSDMKENSLTVWSCLPIVINNGYFYQRGRRTHCEVLRSSLSSCSCRASCLNSSS